MGQSSSQPSPAAAPGPQRRRSSILWSRDREPSHNADQADGGSGEGAIPRPSRRRAPSINRLSQLLHSFPDIQPSDSDAPNQRPSSRLQRARTTFSANLPHFLSRRDRVTSAQTEPSTRTLRRQLSNETPVNDASQYSLPDVRIPDLDLNFEELTRSISAARPATPRAPSRRTSLRLPNGISDRLSGLRQDRGMRNMRLGRRNRSPLRHGEDNTALLSRLLSVAAAATAATLLEGNEQAMSEARSMAQDGDDGTFDGFLQSLESGRLASALRGGGSGAEGNGDNTGSGHAPLNFFRMFRFGSPSNPASRSAPAMASPQQQQPATGPQNMPRDSPSDGRMVPIIIVGIRAVTPGNGNGQEEAPMPPFLDALSALPTSPVGNDTGHEIGNIDSFLRPLRNGTRFSHRRRASMGGISNFPSGYDAQRHHRSPERIRPLSTTSEAASWPRPPPATPASPTLSNVTSRNSTPSQTRPASARSASASRRESIIRTTTTTTLETTTEVEDAPLRPRTARQRRLSESDYTRSTYNSRRNGIVEPDNAPTENTRSWIIYVLGGSYPENHPILTTPSLFTDSPTYEDMMLLSALLGPAKPPVASEQDVADAGGIYKIQSIRQEEGDSLLVAVAAHGDDRVELATEQRCLVCLCDFEQDDEARRLIKCGHLFHQECIDRWLTKGRNSCPLCRGQGVDEKEKAATPFPTGASQTSPDSSPLAA